MYDQYLCALNHQEKLFQAKNHPMTPLNFNLLTPKLP